MFRKFSVGGIAMAVLVCALPILSLRVLAQPSPHGPLSIPCTDCHTTESWKELADPMAFDHAATKFSLQGRHANAACLQCHPTKIFSGASTACYDCHAADFARALTPNHALGKFSHLCAPCHTPNGWRPSIFQHSTTNFQLVGAHQRVECASCHVGDRYSGLPRDCFSCHHQTYSQTTEPGHLRAQFDHDCLKCHTNAGWKPSTFDHKNTNFVLTGAHLTADCHACHESGVFKGLSTDCIGCHQTDFSRSVTVNHAAGQLPHDCTTCHSMIALKPTTFDHKNTNFPLAGTHLTTDCAACHKTGVFK